MYRRNLGRLGTSFQPTVQAYSIPASVGGVNALDSLMAMPPQDAIYTYNLMPVEYGLRLRKGYRQWAIHCGETPQRGTDQDVKTIIGYESQIQDVANDKLFAVTSEGIWDVTLFNTTAPVQEVVFAQASSEAGYGVYCEYTNDAERHFMFYADALNGLHSYEEGVGWSIPPSGIGDTDWYYKNPTGTRVAFNVSDIAFVTVHKLRIWVILENSDDAWYLPLFSTSGELKKFTFGSKLTHGGNLMGLYDWTLDGGDGVDDYLVAVSRGGDVALYRGADPEAADWGTAGTWFIGEVPESRRIVAAYGSEMYILSTYGITSLRDLLQGTVANETRTSPSAKVNRFLRADIELGKDYPEWAVNIHPADGFLQVVTPEPFNTPYIQYNQNVNTKAWGFWSGVPMKCGQTWNGDYFMGGKGGVVWIYDDVLDGTTIDDGPTDGKLGEPINFKTLTSFQAPESHAQFKRAGFVRTVGILAGTATVNVKAVFDYKIETEILPPAVLPGYVQDKWDSSLWEVATWDFAVEGQSFPVGVFGLGRAVAVAIVGSSSTRINIVGWDVLYTRGGYL